MGMVLKITLNNITVIRFPRRIKSNNFLFYYKGTILIAAEFTRYLSLK